MEDTIRAHSRVRQYNEIATVAQKPLLDFYESPFTDEVVTTVARQALQDWETEKRRAEILLSVQAHNGQK